MLGFDLSALCLQSSELVTNAFSFRWCVSFFFVGSAVFLDLAFPLGKLTVVLFDYGFCFAIGCHKGLHIGITVCFQRIGDFVQLFSKFLFGLLYLCFQRSSLPTFEYPLCFGKLCLLFSTDWLQGKNILRITIRRMYCFTSICRLYGGLLKCRFTVPRAAGAKAPRHTA